VVTAQRRTRPADRYALLGRAIAELNAAVSQGRDRIEVLERICAHARVLAGAASATTMIADRDGVLVVRAVAAPTGAWLRGVRVPAGDTAAGSLLRARAPADGPLAAGALSAPLHGSRYRHERALAAAGLRRVLYLPIPGYGSVAGALGVAYRYGAVPGRQRQLLEPLAAVAGLVAADPTTDDPGGLAGVVARDSDGSRDHLQTLVEQVVAMTAATDCAVYLRGAGRALIPIAVADGAADGSRTALLKTAALNGKPVNGAPDGSPPAPADGAGPVDPGLISRLLAERRPATLWRLAEGALLCVPLPARGTVLGALCARWPDRTEPGPADRMLVNLTAAEVAGLVDRDLRRARDEEQVAVQEREWLARELHDSVVQTLYGISLGAGAAGELLRNDTTQAQQSVAWIHETAVAGLTEMHGLIQRLRPDALADAGLTGALGRLLETLHTLHGCRTTAELGPEPPVSAEARRALYRIAQEAIANAAKHARAGQVTLRLYSHDRNVVLEIADDGQGFTLSGDLRGRLGIRSMRERAEGTGGRLDISTEPGRGTVIRAEVPAGADATATPRSAAMRSTEPGRSR
jgi:signal transduction histidine kinase